VPTRMRTRCRSIFGHRSRSAAASGVAPMSRENSMRHAKINHLSRLTRGPTLLYLAFTFSPGEQEPGEVAPADRLRKGDGRVESKRPPGRRRAGIRA
jgi:hypothetical protein